MSRARVLTAGIAVGALALSLAGIAVSATAPEEVKVEDFAVAESLTGEPGDAAKGRDWFAARKLGNCLACHKNSDLDELPFHGEVGPPHDGVGDRWSEDQLRAIIVDPKKIFGEHTIMPAFYRTGGFNRPLEDFQGKTILEAQQVEDIIAYLLTLNE